MNESRQIRTVLKSKPTIEGAGVHLKRVFGFSEVPMFDPFLLLDDFHSSDPRQYIQGFPWHPHRGIETITYVLCGDVEHGDSLGNKGVIRSGDVQWMTAGSGIIHQEMPKGDDIGKMWGFQLWSNLPAAAKMMEPRYRDVKSDRIPEVALDGGVRVKIICGSLGGRSGPVSDIVTDPTYLDITVPAGTEFVHPVKAGHTVFAYVIGGRGYFSRGKEPFADGVEGANNPDMQRDAFVGEETLVLFEPGNQVLVTTQKDPVRFLLVAGQPIGEPVAWQGPIVMNTQEELRVAFEDYRNGTFIRHR